MLFLQLCRPAQNHTTRSSHVGLDPEALRAGRIYLSYHAPDTGNAAASGQPARPPLQATPSARELLNGPGASHGDGAVLRVQEWLQSRGWEVVLGVGAPEGEAAGAVGAAAPLLGRRRSDGGDGVGAGAAGAAGGGSWLEGVERRMASCGAFVALCSQGCVGGGRERVMMRREELCGGSC